MAFRNIYIENEVHLKIKNEQLILTKNENEYSFPLEDINSICIENQRTVITTYALSKFIKHDIVVYVCDEKHLPTGILLGANNYSRQLKNIKLQVTIAKPLNKRIWQNIVKQKIINQAKCLEYNKKQGYEKIENMAERVLSGDSTNIEARAAKEYFRYLFGPFFTRERDCIENAGLNYAYSIVRGMIARTLIIYGFEPAIGIFHHNELNNFNLADDFIEPFRGIIDNFVVNQIDLNHNVLNAEDKRKIYDIVNLLVLIDGKKFNLQGAIEYMIKSYSTSINSGKDCIKVPEHIPMEEYRYA